MNSKSDNRNPTLSLCMIVKNEEEFLPTCLESVKDYVDEIIIVDTGSTDSTVEIAKRYNAKIYHHAWENSFSKARNYSLKYATCDWIIWLDADEEVDKEDAYKLREVIKDNDVNVIFFPLFNKPISGKFTSVFNALKIFRNHLGFHFEGIVHNELKCSGLGKKANIKIYHYGYNLDDEQMENKFIRTSTLLRKQIRSNPDNPLPYHHLAISCLSTKRYDECIKEALEAIRLFELEKSNSQARLPSYYSASAAFYHKKDLVNAEIYALKAIDFYADFMDAYCILSSIYFQRKEYSRCAEVTNKYLKLLKSIESNPTKALNITYNTLNHAWSAHSRMAIIHYEQDQEHEGSQSLNTAISCADNKWEPYLVIGEYFLVQRNLKLAERFLKEGLKNSPDNKKFLLYLGRLYYLRNDLKLAETLYKKALEIDADYADALKGIGTLYLDMKKFEEARIFLYKALQKVKDIEVYNNLGCLEDKEGSYERAMFFFEKALELEPENQVIMNNLKNIQKKLSKEGENPPSPPSRPARPFGRVGLADGSFRRAGSISLCMIVKDEEKFLPRCLESVKDHVDEIIIVDTGSTDSTIEIAKRYNAKIYHHAWENSFSKARNYSLQYATCDWILWLDADEEVDKEDAHKLKEVIKDPIGCETTHSVNAIFLQMLDKPVGGKSSSIKNSKKIFKNHLGFHFVGTVHNYLKCSGPTKMTDIRVYHYGYNLDEEQKEKKFIRTSTLLREQIKYDPNTPIPHHYLAACYLNRKRYDECIKEALEAIRLFELNNSLFELENSETHVRLLAYYVASIAFSHKDDLTNAEAYALKALDYYPDYVDAYSFLSGLYFQRKEYSKCLEVTKKYIGLLKSIESDPTMVLTIPYITIKDAWMAHSRMAIIYYEQNREPEGIQALKDAVNCKGNVCELYLKIGKYFLDQGNFKLAEKFFLDGLKNDPYNKDILYCISEMYKKSGFPDKALVHLEKIVQDYPDEIPAQYHKGLLLFKKNRFDEAINTFESVIDKDPKHIGALFSLAIVYESIGDVTRAKDTYDNILTIKPENPEALASLGYIYMNESNFTRAKECFLNTLKLDKYFLEAHLALSKINLFLNDLEGCVTSCDELLKCLNLPRNITIESISDLSKLYANIGATLLKQQKGLLANYSLEISTLLDPDALEKNAQDKNTLDVTENVT